MSPQDIAHLERHPDFIRLVQRKKRLTWSLTCGMLAIYYGFVVVMAFAPHIMAMPISGGVTNVGIVLTVAVILLSFACTAFYVHQANRILDPMAEKLIRETRT
ncbi:DUF485 domain-containing protein [Pseudomonas sp. Marseille-QA0892]